MLGAQISTTNSNMPCADHLGNVTLSHETGELQTTALLSKFVVFDARIEEHPVAN